MADNLDKSKSDTNRKEVRWDEYSFHDVMKIEKNSTFLLCKNENCHCAFSILQGNDKTNNETPSECSCIGSCIFSFKVMTVETGKNNAKINIYQSLENYPLWSQEAKIN